jgi:enoyl-CoA hydratase
METLELEIADGVAVVRLDRPPVNAVSRLMMTELRTTFNELSQNREVGAVVLGATGEKAFCGGIDLNETAADDLGDADMHDLLDSFHRWRSVQYAVRECLVPVIAAPEKVCIGAGFGLIGVCDLVIAGDECRIGLTEINVGLLGGASKALRLLGPSKARRMMFLGELLPAQELHRLGGIEEVVPAGTAEARAKEIAAQIASKSPIAMRLAKESILRIEGDELMSQYRTENDYTTRLRTYDDSAEAMAAFLEKREPRWTWS